MVKIAQNFLKFLILTTQENYFEILPKIAQWKILITTKKLNMLFLENNEKLSKNSEISIFILKIFIYTMCENFKSFRNLFKELLWFKCQLCKSG